MNEPLVIHRKDEKTNISLRVPNRLLNAIDSAADASGYSRNELIIRLLTEAMKDIRIQ